MVHITEVIREKQTKTTVRYDLTPLRMAPIKQVPAQETASAGRRGEIGAPGHSWWEREGATSGENGTVAC